MCRCGFNLRIVKVSSSSYFATLTIEDGISKRGLCVLPQPVGYKTLRTYLSEHYNLHIPNLSELHFGPDAFCDNESTILTGVADLLLN